MNTRSTQADDHIAPVIEELLPELETFYKDMHAGAADQHTHQYADPERNTDRDADARTGLWRAVEYATDRVCQRQRGLPQQHALVTRFEQCRRHQLAGNLTNDGTAT